MNEATEVIGVIDLKSKLASDLLTNKRSSKFFCVSESMPPKLTRRESSFRKAKPPESLDVLLSSLLSKIKFSFKS